MGTWNETCFLSNLPIESGDPVRLYLLERELNPQQVGNYSYCNEIYKPILRLSGKYNGYGGIECNKDPNYYKALEIYKDKISQYNDFEEFLKYLTPTPYTGSIGSEDSGIERWVRGEYLLFGNLCHVFVEEMAMKLGLRTVRWPAPSQLESVIDFMTATRKAFGPTSGAGSQSTNYKIYEDFYNFLSIEAEARRRAEEESYKETEWDEEEEDWDDINETEGADD